MDIGTYKKTTIIEPVVIPVPQREVEEPAYQPEQEPVKEPARADR